MGRQASVLRGPWILKSWSHDQAVLIRNDKWYGNPDSSRGACPSWTSHDQFADRPAHEIQSLLSGEVSAIYPQPSDISLLDQWAETPGVQAQGSDGAYFEALCSTSAPAAERSKGT